MVQAVCNTNKSAFTERLHYTQCEVTKETLEKKYYKKKREAVRLIKNLNIVFLSKMMQQQYVHHEMIRGMYSTVINNAVDYKKFHPVDKKEARTMFNIAENAIVFAFVAASLNDERKGLGNLIKTLERMGISHSMILAVGDNRKEQEWPLTKSAGAIYDTERLSAAYSCADYFVMPSKQEAFAQTPLEALACGVPVISFPVSGTSELITEINGIRCNGFTSEDLEEGIKIAMNTSYDARVIRKDVIDRFSPALITKKYIELYRLSISQTI